MEPLICKTFIIGESKFSFIQHKVEKFSKCGTLVWMENTWSNTKVMKFLQHGTLVWIEYKWPNYEVFLVYVLRTKRLAIILNLLNLNNTLTYNTQFVNDNWDNRVLKIKEYLLLLSRPSYLLLTICLMLETNYLGSYTYCILLGQPMMGFLTLGRHAEDQMQTNHQLVGQWFLT
jgi:hypothetical protein